MDPRRQRSQAAALKAAGELLVEGRLSAVTVEGVSELSGVAKTTLYRHWPTRTALIRDAFWRIALPPHDAPTDGRLQERLIGPLTRLCDLFVTRSVFQTLSEAVLRDPQMSAFRDDYVTAQLVELRSVLAVDDAGRPPTPPSDDWLLCVAIGSLVARANLLGKQITAADVEYVADFVATTVTSRA